MLDTVVEKKPTGVTGHSTIRTATKQSPIPIASASTRSASHVAASKPPARLTNNRRMIVSAPRPSTATASTSLDTTPLTTQRRTVFGAIAITTPSISTLRTASITTGKLPGNYANVDCII